MKKIKGGKKSGKEKKEEKEIVNGDDELFPNIFESIPNVMEVIQSLIPQKKDRRIKDYAEFRVTGSEEFVLKILGLLRK